MNALVLFKLQNAVSQRLEMLKEAFNFLLLFINMIVTVTNVCYILNTTILLLKGQMCTVDEIDVCIAIQNFAFFVILLKIEFYSLFCNVFNGIF